MVIKIQKEPSKKKPKPKAKAASDVSEKPKSKAKPKAKESPKPKAKSKSKTKATMVEDFIAQGEEIYPGNAMQQARYLYGVAMVEGHHNKENAQLLREHAAKLIP